VIADASQCLPQSAATLRKSAGGAGLDS